jgi:hypothetical protein
MRYIISIINKVLSRDPPKVLGRWSIDYCNKRTNIKIDMSNEDHCGPCGQYALSKIITSQKSLQKNVVNVKDIVEIKNKPT